ncbi:MAG: hypothetical protein H7Y20_19235, partial [Bryobacteraceae bacterium]|nr:hypothetical protein [Bryobacteraceae bacterium]
FLSTPLVQLVTGSLFIENYLALMVTGALLATAVGREQHDTRWTAAASVLCGAALASKFGALSLIVPVMVLLIASIGPNWRARAACTGLFLAFGIHPYLNAWIRTGNPLFPFLNQIFHSPQFALEPLLDPRFREGVNWRSLYDATFHTSRFLESQDGALGLSYLVLLPMTLIAFRRTWPWLGKAALLVSTIGFVLIFAVQSNARYLYPALPLSLIAVGASWQLVRKLDTRLHLAMLAVTLATVLTSAYLLPSSGWYHKDFAWNPLNKSKASAYLEYHAPGRLMVSWLNQNRSGEPVAFLVNGQSAGLQARAYLNSWHTDPFYRALGSAQNATEAAELLRKRGIFNVIAPMPQRSGELPQAALRDLVQNCLETQFIVNGYFAGRLSGTCLHSSGRQ